MGDQAGWGLDIQVQELDINAEYKPYYSGEDRSRYMISEFTDYDSIDICIRNYSSSLKIQYSPELISKNLKFKDMFSFFRTSKIKYFGVITFDEL